MKNRKLVANVKLSAKLHEEILILLAPMFLQSFLLSISFFWFADLFIFGDLFPIT